MQQEKDLEQDNNQIQSNLKQKLDKQNLLLKNKIEEFETLRAKYLQHKNPESSSKQIADSLEQKTAASEVSSEKKELRVVAEHEIAPLKAFLRLKLALDQIPVKEGFYYLVRNEKLAQEGNIRLTTVEKNLKNEPFSFTEEGQARLLARYLIEDNNELKIIFNPREESKLQVVQSIFEHLVEDIEILDLEEAEHIFDEISKLLSHCKENLKLCFQQVKKEKKFTFKEIEQGLKLASLESIDPKYKKWIKIQLFSRSKKPDNFNPYEMFELFSAENRETFLKNFKRERKDSNFFLNQNEARGAGRTGNRRQSQKFGVGNRKTVKTSISGTRVDRRKKSRNKTHHPQHSNKLSSQLVKKHTLVSESGKKIEEKFNTQSEKKIIINIVPVNNFNDQENKEKIEKEEKMISKVELENKKSVFEIQEEPEQNENFDFDNFEEEALPDPKKSVQNSQENFEDDFEFDDKDKPKEKKPEMPMIKLSGVDTFNDAEKKLQLEKNEKMISEVEMPEKDLVLKKEDPTPNPKPRPTIMVNSVSAFNDEASKNQLLKNEEKKTDIKDIIGEEKKKVIKADLKENLKEEKPKFAIKISETSSFNDFDQKKKLEEEEKMISKVEIDKKVKMVAEKKESN